MVPPPPSFPPLPFFLGLLSSALFLSFIKIVSVEFTCHRFIMSILEGGCFRDSIEAHKADLLYLFRFKIEAHFTHTICDKLWVEDALVVLCNLCDDGIAKLLEVSLGKSVRSRPTLQQNFHRHTSVFGAMASMSVTWEALPPAAAPSATSSSARNVSNDNIRMPIGTRHPGNPKKSEAGLKHWEESYRHP